MRYALAILTVISLTQQSNAILILVNASLKHAVLPILVSSFMNLAKMVLVPLHLGALQTTECANQNMIVRHQMVYATQSRITAKHVFDKTTRQIVLLRLSHNTVQQICLL